MQFILHLEFKIIGVHSFHCQLDFYYICCGHLLSFQGVTMDLLYCRLSAGGGGGSVTGIEYGGYFLE